MAAAEPAAPEQESGKLADIERARKESEARAAKLAREAKKLEREADQTARRLVALAAEARVHERAINELRDRLAAIAAERETRSRDLEARHAYLTQVLAALERIARRPPEALMAYARTPQDTLRGAMLLRAAIPKIEAEAQRLRAEIDGLARLGEQAAARRETLAQEQSGLDAKRKQLATLVAKKRERARTTKAEEDKAAARAQALAKEAGDLRELLAAIERDRKTRVTLTPPRRAPPPARVAALPKVRPVLPDPPAAPDGGAISASRGRLIPPVVGRLAASFGAREGPGRAKGIRLETSDGAQVVAPFGGEVVFSGPFRGYGPLLIIDHGEGYHSLLAGLARIDAVVGQKLLTGEPIGVMAQHGKASHRLYMELRQGGRPIDPLPWLAASPNIKVSE
ncbi:MAG: murein hydrolase activator EnvC [Alphaproteobacteria bacterium]